jgi:curved DNA-binding protein CbpA
MSTDYYEVLGCRRDCTQKEIKSACHRLISQFHPDRNPDPTATQFATRLNEAYSVLGNERQRGALRRLDRLPAGDRERFSPVLEGTERGLADQMLPMWETG